MEEVIKFKAPYCEGQINYQDGEYVEVNASAKYGVVIDLMNAPFTFYHPMKGYGSYIAKDDVISGFVICQLMGWKLLEYPEWLEDASEEVIME